MIHAYEIEHMIRDLQDSMVTLQCEMSYDTDSDRQAWFSLDTLTRQEIRDKMAFATKSYVQVERVERPNINRGITTLRGSLLIVRDADSLKRILDRIHQDRSDRKRWLP